MAGNKEFNTNIEVKGKINLKDIPNNTPTGFLVWNSGIKDIAQRTSAQLISDLGLITATNIAASYYTKTEVDTNIKNAVDNIQIGGRNLYRNSATVHQFTIFTTIPVYDILPISEIGKDAVVSFDIRRISGSSVVSVYWYQGSGLSIEIGTEYTNPSTEWTRVTAVGKITQSPIPAGYSLGAIALYDSTGGDYQIRNIKVELGNKPTAWTPAPEDQVSDWNTTDVNDFSFIKNKPATFPPDAHSHTFASITDKPTTIAGYGITDSYVKTQVDTNIKNAVDDIEIGGRNLILNSKNQKNVYRFETFPESYINYDISGGKLEPNTEYILTWEYLTSYNYLPGMVYFISGNPEYEHRYLAGIPTTNDVWVEKKWVFKTGSNPNQAGNIRFDHKGTTDGQNCILSVRMVKLEKGNKATDWTPAPEDQVSDWNQTNETAFDFIKNKPTKLSQFTNDSNFLTQETDPTVPSHVKSISSVNITNWNTAFGWGDHKSQGYLKSIPNDYVTLNSNQNITSVKAFNNNQIKLSSLDDPAHYIKHFNDDTDGFGISSGFSIKPYNNETAHLFKVNIDGSTDIYGKTIIKYGENNVISSIARSEINKLATGFNFDWYDSRWSIGNVRSGSDTSLGFAFNLNDVQKVFIYNDGNISTQNYGSSLEWNQSFGWGDHKLQGYLTSSALSPYAQTSWVNANFDKYTAWNLNTNGEQSLIVTAGSTLDIRAGINVDLSYENSINLEDNTLTGLLTIHAVNTDTNTTYVQGDGISITGGNNVITNTKPNIVQTLSGSGNTVNLSNGGSYTIPAQAWASITGKPEFNFLPINPQLTYGASGLNYFNISGVSGNNPILNQAPTDSWHHIIRMNHANAGGYYADLAISMVDNSGISRRVISNGGALSDWVKMWDSSHFTQDNINNWNTAFSWGDYRQFGLGRPNELTASDLNSVMYTSILGINDATSNRPFGYGSVWTHRKSNAEYSQIAIDVFTGKLISRAFSGGSGDTGWKTPLYSEDLSNYVTLGTEQTITARKLFNNFQNQYSGASYTILFDGNWVRFSGGDHGDEIGLVNNDEYALVTSLPGQFNFAGQYNGNYEDGLTRSKSNWNYAMDTTSSPSHKLSVGGSILATAFYESSLREYKTNIKPFDKSALDLVDSLSIVTFDRKDETVKDKIGVIADDSPKEFLSEELDAVDLYKTVFIQAKAIQELTKKLEYMEKLIKNITDGR